MPAAADMHGHPLRVDVPLLIILSVQLIGCATAFTAPPSRGVLLKSARAVKTWQQPCGGHDMDASMTSRRRGHSAQVLMAAPSDRRSSLSAFVAAGVAAAALPVPPARADYGQGRYDEILSRVTGLIDGEYKNPGFGYDACFGLCSDKQLYLPKWLEGSWEVESTYMGKAFPRGEKYVYRSIREGSARSAKEKVGDVTSYKARYVAAEAGGSAFGVGRGEKKTIQDRAFNTAEMLNAYAGYRRVLKVDYEAGKDPTRMTMSYPMVGGDMRPIGEKRTEVFINNRDGASSPDGTSFACTETFRAVTLAGGGDARIADSETACVYERDSDTQVKGRVRGFVYLIPSPNSREGEMYMQVGPRAVAVYDYALSMKKVAGP